MGQDDSFGRVFESYGRAAYEAQCFEVELRLLLFLTMQFASIQNPSAHQLEGVLRKLSKITLGKLLEELRSGSQLHPELAATLQGYRRRRNYLMHDFFFSNA